MNFIYLLGLFSCGNPPPLQEIQPDAAPLRRLTLKQYKNTLSDLFPDLALNMGSITYDDDFTSDNTDCAECTL